MTLDAKRGIVYVPTGSPVFDFYGADRVGDDLFADTLLALWTPSQESASGTFRACITTSGTAIFQPRRPWSRSTATAKPIDAVAQTTKQGFLFLFDRATGKPLFPIEEKKFPPARFPEKSHRPPNLFRCGPLPSRGRL